MKIFLEYIKAQAKLMKNFSQVDGAHRLLIYEIKIY